jgi:hypothetical protein
VRCEADPETAGKRPFRAVPHNALIEGRYYCPECRYLPCAGCGKAAPCTRYRFKIWLCRECATEGSYTCERCQEAVPVADVCRDSDRSLAHRGKGGTRSIYYCIACSRPRCAACGDAERDPSECKSDRSDVQLSFNGEDVRRTWYCGDCQECNFCRTRKPKRTSFRPRETGSGGINFSERCKECEHPRCGHCGRRHKGAQNLRLDNPWIIDGTWYCERGKCRGVALELRKAKKP